MSWKTPTVPKSVSWDDQKQRWVARVQIRGQRKRLGLFKSMEDAAYAVAMHVAITELEHILSNPKQYMSKRSRSTGAR